MDWLMFKFCVLISVFVSKSRSQFLNSTKSLSRSSDQLQSCEEGQPVPSPDQCNSCICYAGLVYCSNFSCEEQECVHDEVIPKPDPCNECICRRGKVTCTQMICIPAPDCTEKRLYPSQNYCNVCMCLNGFITCTSNDCTEENLFNVTITTTTTKTPQKSKICVERSRLPGPNKCVECTCVNGKKKCKDICTTSVQPKTRFTDIPTSECVSGRSIPKPDECNNCICFEGEVHCTHIPCHTGVRVGQECRDDQPVYRPDECNECYCFEGKLQCSDVVCIRGSKCVEGEVIPKPDRCNTCKCIDGHILCTNYPCPDLDVRSALIPEISPADVKSAECQDGDAMPPLPPPFECNTCFCIENRIMCTMKSCVDSIPEIKGRLKEENEPNHLEIFDKQISVEPIIDILYKNNDKLPTKVIHTHAYNGFHQEIKVHANHLPKDATGLLKALATTLNNSALASISQKLLTSSDSPSNDNEVVQNNLLGEGNVFTTQSSKLITSGSLSNETILVIPDSESLDSEYPKSMLPLSNKHETFWKTVSAPAPTVYHDNQLIKPRNSREENQNIHHNDRPPVMPAIQHSDIIRNPSKFTHPGLPRTFSTNPKPDTLEVSNVNTPFNPTLGSKPMSVNSGKMNYAPLYQENNNQFKPVPSGFGANPLGQNPIFNYTKPSPVFGPGQLIATQNVNGGQQNPPQSQFAPNPIKYYFNQVKPQELQFTPNQNHPRHIIISNSNNKGIQYPPLYPNTPNQPIVSANQYKTPQFGLQPGQGNPFNNIGNQTDQKLKHYPSNFQIPNVNKLPDQNNRISGFEIQPSKEKPKFGPNSPHDGVNLQNIPLHTQHIPNPSIYYKHEYEAPKINEINPDEEQLLPITNFLPSKPTIAEPYNQPHTYSEPDHETIMPKVRNKTKKYNTTHSHYAKHTSVTYVSENDPNDPANPIIVEQEPNHDHNAPHSNDIGYYLPDQKSQELDLTIPKVTSLDQKEPYDKSSNHNPSQTSFDPLTTDNNKYNPYSSGIHPNQNRTDIPVYPYISPTHNPSESQFMPLVGNGQKESLNDPNGSQSPTNSVEYPMHQKIPPSQTGPIQNQPPRFQYAHNANQEPLQQKPINELPISEFVTPQNNNLPGILDDRGSADGFQYPSHSAEDPTHLNTKLDNSTNYDPNPSHYDPVHPRDNLHITPQSQFVPTQNKHKPGMIDNHGIKDGYQYAHNANQNPMLLKPSYDLSDLLFSPTDDQQNPETLDEKGLLNSAKNPIQSRGSANIPQKPQLSPNQVQYPLISADHPLRPKENTKMPLNLIFGPTQYPEIIDDRGSAGGFHYPSNSAEKSMHPTDQLHNSLYPEKNPYRPLLPLFGSTKNEHLPNFHYPINSTKNIKQPHSLYDPIQNQHLPGIFDERGSPDGLQYPSHSAENPLNQKQPNFPYGPTQNQHSPGIPNDRGTAGGFQYPSHSTEKPLHQKQPNFPYGPTQNQHSPGITDNRGSAGGFQYPSHSSEKPLHLILPNSPYGTTQNHHSPGIPDDRGSTDGFQYPSHSAENPSHQKQPNSPYGPTQNQHSPGIPDDRGSAGGFPYPSNSAENPSQQKQPNSLYGPTQNQHLPGILDERGSADGFQYPSHSTDDTTHPKDKLTHPPIFPIQNEHLLEIFGEPGNSTKNPLHPKDNRHQPLQSQFLPSHNQYKDPTHKQPDSLFRPKQNKTLPGMFDERGSSDGFQYPSHTVESPLQPKDNRHQPLQSQFLPSHNQYKDPTHKQPDSLFRPNQNKTLPGMFDERGSPDGFQYPSHTVESPLQAKDNRHQPLQSQFLPSDNQYKDPTHKQPDSLFSPNQNKTLPGMFDERGAPDGFQYPSHTVESPLQPKDNRHQPPQSQFLPSHNQYKDPTHKQPDSLFSPNQNKTLPGMFDERGSPDGFQYPSHTVESPLQTKDNGHHPLQSQFLPSHKQYKDNTHKKPNSPFSPPEKQYLPAPYNKLQSSPNEDPTLSNGNIHHVPHPQFYPNQEPQNNNVHKLPEFPFGPTQIHDLPEVFKEVSQSTEDPTHSKTNPDRTPVSKFTPKIHNEKADKPDQMQALHPISPTGNNYNNNNPLRPWVHLDHDQYKPSSLDNLLNGVHNVPWSLPDDHKVISNIVSSTPQPEFESHRDKSIPSSLDNLLNKVHNIPLPENHKKVLNTITSAPKARLKPEYDQYKPWPLDNSLNGIHQIPWPIPNQDSVTDAEITTPSYTNSDRINSHPETKPDGNAGKVLPIDDDEISNYYDQLYPLLNVLKKLSELPLNESALTVDQLDLPPDFFPKITKILNNDPENDTASALPVENKDFQSIFPWSTIKSKLKQLPISGDGMLNWLKNKLNKLVPINHNISAISNNIDMPKIINLLKKLMGPKTNDNAVSQNISLTTTALPLTDATTHSYDNRIKTNPKELEENQTQAPQVKYPDVHIILHQPNDQDDLDLPPFIETDGVANLATDVNSEELGTLFSKMFNPRFKHRQKDQKDECGDGTHWISNCHGCYCYFGQPMCFKMHDCDLRPFGEPMKCKPYSHFKMGCYTCECNGDGVAECEAKDCDPKLSGDTIVTEATVTGPLEFKEFFDSKMTDEILQYYNTYKKLPKYCPKAQNPTCEPGTSWTSSCHKCECNETGKHECIKIDGCKLDFDSYGKPSRCKPNSKFYPKTNSVPCVECSCDDEGKSYCPAAE